MTSYDNWKLRSDRDDRDRYDPEPERPDEEEEERDDGMTWSLPDGRTRGEPLDPDMSPYAVRELLHRVRAGLVSALLAARLLGWTLDDVCMAIWGRVVL